MTKYYTIDRFNYIKIQKQLFKKGFKWDNYLEDKIFHFYKKRYLKVYLLDKKEKIVIFANYSNKMLNWDKYDKIKDKYFYENRYKYDRKRKLDRILND